MGLKVMSAYLIVSDKTTSFRPFSIEGLKTDVNALGFRKMITQIAIRAYGLITDAEPGSELHVLWILCVVKSSCDIKHKCQK